MTVDPIAVVILVFYAVMASAAILTLYGEISINRHFRQFIPHFNSFFSELGVSEGAECICPNKGSRQSGFSRSYTFSINLKRIIPTFSRELA